MSSRSWIKVDEAISEQERRPEASRSSSEILRLKKHRNGLVSVGRLPPELIVHVITILQGRGEEDPLPFSPTWKTMASVDKKWRLFTYASSYLRRVSLDSPKIWSLISAAWSKEWIELCLANARVVPLAISAISISDDPIFDLSYFPRAHTLQVEAFDSITNTRSLLSYINSHPFHQLRHFECSLRCTIPITPDFLGGTTARLEHLVLMFAEIHAPPPSEGFPALKVLELQHIALYCKHEIGLLIGMIASAPNLVTLFVDSLKCGHRDGRYIGPYEHPAQLVLPHLQTVRISSPSPSLTWQLLHALPNPNQLLWVDMSRASASPDEEHGIVHYSAQLHARFMEHANARGTRDPVGLLLTHDGELMFNMTVTDPARLSSKELTVHYRCPILPGVRDPFLNDITVLRVGGEGHGRALSQIPADSLSRLQILLVQGATEPQELDGMVEWVRALKGHRTQLICAFAECDEKVRPVFTAVREVTTTAWMPK
jgi:hypothetical protein